MALINNLNANFKQLQEENKVNTGYLTGGLSTEKKMFEQVKEMKRSTFDRSKFTVVGNPAITEDGILTGQSNSNYLRKSINIPSGSNIRVIGKFKSQSDLDMDQRYWSLGDSTSRILSLEILKNRTTIWCVRTLTQTALVNRINEVISITPNTDLYIDFDYNQSNKTLSFKYSFDGKTWMDAQQTQYATLSENLPVITYIDTFWGVNPATDAETDLKQFSIEVDGKEVFNSNKTGVDTINNIEIPYTLSKTGSKIVDAIYRDRVQQVYEEQGSANYYTILDGEKYYVTKVGNPTLENGIASGFSSSDYLTKDITLLPTQSLKIHAKGVFNTNANVLWCDNNYLRLAMSGSNLCLWNLGSGQNLVLNTLALTDNEEFECICEITSTKATITAITKNGTFTRSLDTTHTFKNITKYYIGALSNGTFPWFGQIDLSQFSIEVDGKEVFRGYEANNFTLPKGEVYGMLEDKQDTINDLETIRSKASEVDNKVNKSGDTITGSLTVQDKLNLGTSSRQGAIELWGGGTSMGGYIDFHNGSTTSDWTSRIIETSPGEISVQGNGMNLKRNASRPYFHIIRSDVTKNQALSSSDITWSGAVTFGYSDANLASVEHFCQNNMSIVQFSCTKDASNYTIFAVGRDANNKQWFSHPQIISSYNSGNSGYIIWSNGYCEQWGHTGSVSVGANTSATITVTFLKTFSDGNYVFTYVKQAGGNGYANVEPTTSTKNAGSAVISVWGNGGSGTISSFNWKACGYLASNQY